MVSSLAVSGRMISTSFIAGAGLKKCTPHTCDGREVAIASSMTGNVEVFVARMALGCTIASSSANRAFFTARSSTTDSITRSQPASADSWSVAVIRPMIACRSSSVARPRSIAFTSPLSMDVTIASALACDRDRTTTW